MKFAKFLWFMLLLLFGDVVITAFNMSAITSIVLGALWGAFVGYLITKGVRNG